MALDKLLYLQGVGAEFIDCFGRTVIIPEDDRRGILQTMCADQVEQPEQLFTPEFIQHRNYVLDAAGWKDPLPDFQWCYVDDLRLNLYLPADIHTDIALCITTEQGQTIDVHPRMEQLRQVGDYRIDENSYFHYQVLLAEQLDDQQLSTLAMGYHRLETRFSNESLVASHGQWMVVPRQVYQPAIDRDESVRCWGVNIQLYALRSQSPWKIGDFGDLNDVINWIAAEGADFILLNPLHALNISAAEDASPYSPCDRRRMNPLYIQIEQLPEYKALSVKPLTLVSEPSSQDPDKDNWLDYTAIHQHKYQIFIQLYQIFCAQHLAKNTARAKEFKRFVKQQGASLQDFARNEAALCAATLAQPDEFFVFLQFVAEQQFSQCQQNAKKRGMSIGIIRDLAVGAVSEGEEVTANAEQFCLSASIGAPPDPFAPQGQNWQLTPLDPVKLKQHQYQHFIQLIRANMRHCGALRMDHIMSLMRLWWWPKDDTLGNGAYVYYPFDTLLAILCLESHRSRCLIIGEDLGVVPPEIVSRLYDAGIISNELFYFCKHEQGFKSPEQYKSQSLMMLTNHDVPTLAAWWRGFDLTLRHQLALLTSQELSDAQHERQQEKQQVIELLIEQKAIAQDSDMENIDFMTLVPALAAVVASGNARLFSIPLSDLIGDEYPVNIPGTWKEYPNWRRRHLLTIEQCAKNKNINYVLGQIAKQRPNLRTRAPVSLDGNVTSSSTPHHSKRHG
ncbi:4-alpha-glucanotransferase [Neptunicella sp.]|uniref:4-alpha-glucanotransferase n=1 Tax=Neptunicella sp. TaxID=2125986 RepID=UPI003F69348A